MSGIKIPVSAQFDNSGAEQQIKQMQRQFNELGKVAASLGDVKFNPIDKATLDDLKEMTKRFEAIKKSAPGLTKRLHNAGQGDKNWNEVDWKQAFPQDYQRTRYMHTLVNILREGSASYVEAGQSGSGGRSRPNQRQQRPFRDEVGRQGRNILNSAGGSVGGGYGGVGSAVTDAAGTAFSMGAGAGLAGLLGGLLAVGVGKAVGAATEKIGAAEDDQIGYDKLKRAIGEPPRLSRRPQFLREWGHHDDEADIEEIFAGGP